MSIAKPFLKQLARAIKAGSPLPKFPADISLQQAYQALPELTALVETKGSAGIKAGLTMPDIQALFGLEHSLIAQLYKGSQLANGAQIANTANTVIECEIAITVDKNGKPVSYGPAIEIVQLSFSEPSDMTAANLVLSNMGAKQFILGEQQAWPTEQEIHNHPITLSRNGEVILEASINDSLGGPKQGSEWILAEIEQRQLPIEDGDVILLGTCGAAVPVEVGEYIAEYGEFGSVSFEVT